VSHDGGTAVPFGCALTLLPVAGDGSMAPRPTRARIDRAGDGRSMGDSGSPQPAGPARQDAGCAHTVAQPGTQAAREAVSQRTAEPALPDALQAAGGFTS
jgi:hypothetical protein